jgi:phospholipid N-methyltransferase
MLHEHRLFLREYARHFHTTGSLVPSSRWLAAALASYVVPGEQPLRIVEVGPGTGAVTRAIARRLGPHDQLDLVELNPRFAEHLRECLTRDPVLRPIADRTRVIQAAVQELPQDRQYHLVISGLPLNNFAAELVEQLLNSLAGLLRPGGTLSFFQYVAIRKLRALVGGRADRARLRAIGMLLQRTLQAHAVRRDLVLRNLPPAWVHHLRFD